jgi:hypothetical protein
VTDPAFHKDIIDAFEQTKQSSKGSSPEKDVIDNDLTSNKVRGARRVTRAVKSLPFATKDLHDTSMQRRSIAGAKRHHRPAPLFVVGPEKSELLLIPEMHPDLMVTDLVDEKGVNGILANQTMS